MNHQPIISTCRGPLPRISSLLGLLLVSAMSLVAAEPLQVCATVTDLGDLTKAVGGDAVAVTVFARGGDDPHTVEPRPSFAKSLAKASLVVSTGMELESEWLPVVVEQSRNAAVVKGTPGWFEAAPAIKPLGVPPKEEGHSHGQAGGHVHGAGNPHFLGDPVCGVQVAQALAERLAELAPDRADAFHANYRTFAREVAVRLLGEAPVKRVGDAVAISAVERDALADVIGTGADLGGWLGAMKPVAGSAVIADHDQWPYVARRFAFVVVGFLEPMPGVPPTTRHLASVVELAKTSNAKGIITMPSFDQRHVRFVADATGLPVIPLANQAGAIPEAPGWLDSIDRNVKALATGLKGGK
jgi:ABC-type Zn uptake system ZnuABC Zn-binding protein ZnuA